MRGMLIDDDQAVARLRHDVIVVHLRPRRAERMIERIGAQARMSRHARSSAAGADIEHGLRRFGKAERGIAVGCKTGWREGRAAKDGGAAGERR